MEIALALITKQKEGKTILVYQISLMYRIIMSLIFILLTLAVFSNESITVSGIIILTICFLALLYEETWIFDNTSGTIVYYFGLMLLKKKRVFSFQEIDNFSINHFARGKMNQEILPAPEKMPFGSQTRLILNLKSNKPVLINTMSFTRRKKLIDDAESIARYTNIALNFDN